MLVRDLQMAKVHAYIRVRPDGACEIAKSNGPICIQQSRQEVGGPVESFNPQLGDGFNCPDQREPRSTEAQSQYFVRRRAGQRSYRARSW